VDKTAKQHEIQQFESTGFQDPQAAAETSGSYYCSTDGKLEGKGEAFKIYILSFLAGKFILPRA